MPRTALLASLALALPALAASVPSEHASQAAQFGDVAMPRAVRAGAPRGAPTPGPDVIVYGYQAYWNADLDAVPWDQLSHLALFNADVDTAGNLSNTGRWADADYALQLAQPYGVRVHLCVTNFDSAELATLLTSTTARAQLVANLKQWVTNTGAHGVNVDFEGLPVSARDGMVSLVQELKAANVGDIVLATPAVDWNGSWDYDVLAADAHLFIMGYGYHWSGGNPGPVDPLYGGGIWGRYSLDWTVNDYTTWGTPPEKIILGLPLYGRHWPMTSPSTVPGTASGTGVAVVWATAQTEASTWGRQWDADSRTPYYVTSTGQGWYGDVESLRLRVQYARAEGLGGIGFWALHYDGGDQAMWDMIAEETTFGGQEPGDTGDTGLVDTGSPDTDPPGPAVFTADAGLPFLAYPGDTIELDASGSRGPAGVDLQVAWTQVAGPAVTLDDPTAMKPRFVVDERGTHVFEVVVGDGTTWSEPASSYVVVLDGPTGCGCDAPGGSGGAALGLAGLLLARRRRSRS